MRLPALRHLLAIMLMAATMLSVVAVNRADAAFPGVTEPPVLASLATQIVGAPTTVVCVPISPADLWAGWVYLGDPAIYMQGDKCGALLNAIGYGTPRYSARTAHWLTTFAAHQDVGYAFLTFVHEATHLIAINRLDRAAARDEGLTECVAFRNAWNYTRLLGLPWKLRQAIYRAVTYAHFGKSPTGPYRTYC